VPEGYASHKNEWSGALVDSWVKLVEFPAIFGLLSTTKTPSTMADDDDDDRGPPLRLRASADSDNINFIQNQHPLQALTRKTDESARAQRKKRKKKSWNSSAQRDATFASWSMSIASMYLKASFKLEHYLCEMIVTAFNSDVIHLLMRSGRSKSRHDRL